jgi:hypothetical protein
MTTSGVAAQSPLPGASEALASGPSITVTARDQYFAGLPMSLPVGSRLRMANTGTEVHQMVIARRIDGVAKSWDELLADPDPVGAGFVELVGQLFAAPGESAAGEITIPRPGDYFAVCFVPQGITVIPDPAATPDPEASAVPLGPAHYRLGMRQEFRVTVAGSTPGPLPTATVLAPSGSPGRVMPSASP